MKVSNNEGGIKAVKVVSKVPGLPKWGFPLLMTNIPAQNHLIDRFGGGYTQRYTHLLIKGRCFTRSLAVR